MSENSHPYVGLGNQLRKMREQRKRSVEEVSGALEINETELKKIEEGLIRPNEDIMMLFISYYNMPDQEASYLWKLAKYESSIEDHLDFDPIIDDQDFMSSAKPVIMIIPAEPKALFTDSVDITWNHSGLTMDFSQATPKGKLSVAKVGMSLEQAQELKKILETAILYSKNSSKRKLIPPRNKPEK